MKVRWNSSSLRLRITPPELEALRVSEEVLERMSFGPWRVRLGVGRISQLEALEAELRVQLSSADLATLLEPSAEGVYLVQDGFRYYVEKDFPCEHPRDVEVSPEAAQTFPRPDPSS